MSRYDWMEHARCAQVDPGLWHADKGANYTAAKRICASCPVRPQCEAHTARLDTEVSVYDKHGVWAGQTKKQRETARANAARQAQHTAIVRLLERGGMTPQEIADQAGCSSRTVLRVQKTLREQGAMA
ncbi:WhiB family transcriptional regulator [Streptomyces cacaoi]